MLRASSPLTSNFDRKDDGVGIVPSLAASPEIVGDVTTPVNVGLFRFAFRFNAVCVADDIGFN